MAEKAEKLLEEREEYLRYLGQAVQETDRQIAQIQQNIQNLERSISNVRSTSSKLQHEALIPLGKNIYVNGIIHHTQEYFVDHNAHPEKYSTLVTLDDVIDKYEKMQMSVDEDLEKLNVKREQLDERIKVLKGEEDEFGMLEKDENAGNMPERIASERGVATKVGGFYEILEFEN